MLHPTLWKIIFIGFLALQIAGQTSPKPETQAAPATPDLISEALILETPTGKIYGTLLAPKTAKPVPLAIIIAGSGPTNRDGNSMLLAGANNSLKYLAEGLSQQGIATLRYDKRGVGESLKALSKESDIRFDHYIDDAVLWGEKLRADKRFSLLAIIGHSEGSLIGMVAAEKLKANGYVSIAGAGRVISETLLEQLKSSLPGDLYLQSENILKELKTGKTVTEVPPTLAALFRPSVQPYLISWLKYDPAQEIARLAIPILILQGTNDLQVKVEEAKRLSAAKPDARLVILEGVNHVLKEVPAEREKQLSSYSDPALPVAPKLINEIVRYLKGIKR